MSREIRKASGVFKVMGIIAKSTIQEVNDKIDPVAVIGDYVGLEKRSGEYIGLCPFHNEKTPSFSVNPERKLYYCFGCGKGGTVINFVMEMDKLSFTEAIEVLAKRFGVPMRYENAAGSPGKDQEQRTRIEEITELYRRVAGSFHYWLKERPEGQSALHYIIDRGISMEMIETFRLGYAPANRRWLFQFLIRKGYSESFLASSMLFSSKDPHLSFFFHRLMFPITDRQGRTLAFGGRLLSGDGPKYINSAESDFYKKGLTLFGIDQALGEIRKTKEAYIAEGYMDVIALHQAGITNAVAPLGTALTDEQAKFLRRWVERVNLIFDSDKAGQQATVKAILTCRRNGLVCAVAVPHKGAAPAAEFKDPADILKEAGLQVLQKRMKYCMLDCEYLMFHSKSLFDISSAEGKTKAITFMFPYLKTLDSDVSRELVIEQIGEAFGVDQRAIRNDFNRTTPVHQGGGRKDGIPKKLRSIRMSDELYLLIVVLVNYQLYPKFRTKLVIKDIEDPAAKEIFIALEEWYVHDEAGMDALLAHINSEELRSFVVEKGSSKNLLSNPEQLMWDGIKKVKRRRLEKRRDQILLELMIARDGANETQNDFQKETRLEELLAEKMHIDAELHQA
ncbi:MAG: DNA primase [Treponema sp.]|jgi:DNA primase|nr:DNA primase [Treponema sp.]